MKNNIGNKTMKDSGMSNSQFMKAQKAFQAQHPEYDRLLKSLQEQEEKSLNLWEKFLIFVKKCVKYK